MQMESVIRVESDGDSVERHLDDGAALVAFELHLADFVVVDVAKDSSALPAVAGRGSAGRGDRQGACECGDPERYPGRLLRS